MRRPAILAPILFALAATGCVMPEQMSRMQKDINDIRQQLRHVQAEQQEALQTVAELERRAAEGEGQVRREEVADLQSDIGRVDRQVATVEERMGDLERRLDTVSVDARRALSQSRTPVTSNPPAVRPPEAVDVAAPPSGGVADPRPATDSVIPDPNRLFNTAYEDFSRGNYALAVEGFEEYQQRFPDNPLADNALYWVGECHFSQGDFRGAVRAFDRLLETYPDSDRAAAGHLKKGLALHEMNRVGDSILQLRRVVADYPGSDEARLARDKLTSLGAQL